MSPSRKVALGAGVLMLLTLPAGAALAHGPATAPIGIAAETDGVPTLIQLTEGMALWRGSHWRFLCPATWGSSPDAPLASSTPDRGLWVAGDDQLYSITPEGTPVQTGTSELSAVGVRQFEPDSGGLFAPAGAHGPRWSPP